MSIFDTVKVPKVQRTRIKGRSHSFDFNCRIGDLIPICAEECVAGDIVKVGVESTIRFPTLKKPLFSENWFVDFFYFFVPYRILWSKWEKFLPVFQSVTFDGQGGVSGSTPSLPRVTRGNSHFPKSTFPLGSDMIVNGDDSASMFEMDYEDNVYAFNAKFTLNDYLSAVVPGKTPTSYSLPVDLHHRAYASIYEYFFRDENVDRHTWDFENKCFVVFGYNSSNYAVRAGIMSRARKKNYFTGGLPFVQKGPAPALPLYGSARLIDDKVYALDTDSDNYRWMETLTSGNPGSDVGITPNAPLDSGLQVLRVAPDRNAPGYPGGNVDLSSATSADINEVWTAMQIQKFLIRNARCGTRYNEFLLANYGVAPHDETLQRPIFIGSTRQPVFISEVTQQSETGTTPQGTLTAKAMSTGADYICKYSVNEPGVIMGLMCITPGEIYSQGVERFYLKNSPYDFYNRLFENLSDVPVMNAEIFEQDGDGTTATDNRGVFNFQPIFSEYKSSLSRVAGDMRDSLDVWHTAREFASLPQFNEAFLHRGYDSLGRLFADNASGRNCVCHVYNKFDMLRPMSYLNMVGSRI